MPKIIKLSGVVGWDITAKGLENKIDRKDKNTVFLDSVGGSVFEGNRLYNLLNDLQSAGVDIDFVLGAVAASASSYFPMAVGSKNIRVRDNTIVMGHKAWALAIGDADDMQTESDILNGMDRMISKAYSKVNGKSIEENLESMKNEFWLMGGQSVIDAGFASGIYEPNDDESDIEEPEGKEKNEVQALMKEAQALLREKAQEEDLEKWAAKLIEPPVTEEGQIEMFQNKTVTTPETPGNKIIEETDMKFLDYLNQNPEHKAEFEEIKAAMSQDRDSEIKADRERSAKIVKLYGNTEGALAAIADGTSVGDLAVAEKEKAVDERKTDNQDLGGLDKTKGQLPDKSETKESQKDEAVEKSVSAYLEGVK